MTSVASHPEGRWSGPRSGFIRTVSRLGPWSLLVVGTALAVPSLVGDGGSVLAADDSSPGSQIPTLDSQGLLGAFLAVAGVLWSLPSFLRQFQGRKAGRVQRIQVLEVQRLSTRRSLILAQVGSRQILVGSSECGLTCLASLPPTDADLSRENAAGDGAGFAEVFRQVEASGQP